eukprot:CAMPEP_0197434026 /NCGR_PEP_ID=MMETSP1175-20131217/1813_1 /TAXON_ID=1003142 /ORGANISM="Triceratium dubium, Strain CCMP147" /LENGTH=181 /DNA_ID=CAMNT_0042962595 /DNA_START=55 /DNA_END=600 /DNA_ORIENTATION=+
MATATTTDTIVPSTPAPVSPLLSSSHLSSDTFRASESPKTPPVSSSFLSSAKAFSSLTLRPPLKVTLPNGETAYFVPPDDAAPALPVTTTATNPAPAIVPDPKPEPGPKAKRMKLSHGTTMHSHPQSLAKMAGGKDGTNYQGSTCSTPGEFSEHPSAPVPKTWSCDIQSHAESLAHYFMVG